MQLPSPGNECAFKKRDEVCILCLSLPVPLLIRKSPLKEVMLREYFIKINRDLEFTTFT